MKNTIKYIFCFIGLSGYAQLETISTEYEYDNLNRLVQVISNGESTRSYTYDDLGNRITSNFSSGVELTYVPDDAFEQELINLGYDDVMDDYVVTENISGIETLNLNQLGVQDLTGIEDFSNLEVLEVLDNEIEEIDLAQNENLITLQASINPLININLSQNGLLESLFCSQTLLNNIDLGANTNLEFLSIDTTPLSTLDVSNNTSLVELIATDCGLSELDISNNIQLEWLDFGFNFLDDLDLTNNPNLINLNLRENSLTNINVNQNPQLRFLIVPSNNLDELDLSNNNLVEVIDIQSNNIEGISVNNIATLNTFLASNNSIESLDFSDNTEIDWISVSNNDLSSLNVQNGNNEILQLFSALNNPNLTCVQVDDEDDANAGVGVYGSWGVDDQVEYSEDCESLGVQENTLDGINISPNPTDNFLVIQISTGIENNLEYKLYDLLGKEIITGTIPDDVNIFQLDLTTISSGNYILDIFDSNKHFSSTIIKN